MRRGISSLQAVAFALSACLLLSPSGAQDDSAIDFFNEPTEGPDSYYSALHPCPRACGDKKPDEWDVYFSFKRFELCNQPMLFDMAVYSSVEDRNAFLKLRVCKTGDADTSVNALSLEGTAPEAARRTVAFARPAHKRDQAVRCARGSEGIVKMKLGHRGEPQGSHSDLITILEGFDTYFQHENNCNERIVFGYSNGTVAGLYVGSSFGKATVTFAIDKVIDAANGLSSNVVAEICGAGRNADHVLGIAIDTTGNVAAVQKAVRDWDGATCAEDLTGSSVSELKVWEQIEDSWSISNGTANNSTLVRAPGEGPKLALRADCRTIQVTAGDSCGALATRCGITPAKFTEYNKDPKLCSGLIPGQRVCCSAGTLPDIRPKPNPDGKELEGFNEGVNGTWGWTGCELLMAGINICLSKGDPPMPAPVSNAICGPTKPGSKPPAKGKSLADLNPCPLNVCCNIWGQCGITNDFCVEKRGESGNPGTSPKGTYGCISNCGSDIVSGGEVKNFGRIGYYESWNFNRECLHLRASNANTNGYTIIHWAFMEIDTANWSVKLKDDFDQWKDFKGLKNVKRVISFGGWAYSNEPETYDILRQAMSPANRNTFARNVASFLEKERLDGVDFDWEYPGATDVPGTPPGLPSDGPNYLKFLTLMRQELSKSHSLSIAAPASYWYLKQFPIAQMAKTLDYIVFMTYDLHGQWDAGNQWAMDGCPAGNCLRSHVNLTETNLALSMITKAGVPSSMIYVGESSYGRSFKMTKAGCDGPTCTFEGERLWSEAMPGMCTDTAGYISNAEIEQIKATTSNVKVWHDARSNSDVMVYYGQISRTNFFADRRYADKRDGVDTEWVAYMTETTKATRRERWQGLGFAGTIDWAVDLQQFTDDDYLGPGGAEQPDDTMPPLEKCTGSYEKLEDIEKDMGNMKMHCRSKYVLQALKKMLSDSLSSYDSLITGGYDESFGIYADAVVGGSRKAIEEFMYARGDEYFSCIITETVDSCYHCHYKGYSDKFCRYCEEYDCGWEPVCDQPEVNCWGHEDRFVNYSMPCPPDYSKRSSEKPEQFTFESTYWTLRKDRADQFWVDIYEDVGISEENVHWENVNHWGSCSGEHCPHQHWDYNFPAPFEYERDDVGNPKDVVEEARGNLNELGPSMSDLLQDIDDNAYMGNLDDVVNALSLPIIMVEDAIKNMQKIKDLANQIDEAKRKSIILAFLSAIFFFLPIAGQVLGSVAALANVARILSMIGTLGSIGLDIQSLVEQEGNDPLVIMGLVLAPLAILDSVRMSTAAKIRRGMSGDDIAKLGEAPKARIDTIDRIMGSCALPKLKPRDFPLGGLPMSDLAGREIFEAFSIYA
ncbi:hypothetical protein DL769_000587 [Monosporascus sp. CRB-8-3]|nr:hypothetical protein DL769_000587 [Monosporascus sp. CRB-8-3]